MRPCTVILMSDMRLRSPTPMLMVADRIKISTSKLRTLAPSMYGFGSLYPTSMHLKMHLAGHLEWGDSRAAVVVSTEPLLVATYSKKLDCVAVLQFPTSTLTEPLEVGTRLLSVNSYKRTFRPDADLTPGPLSTGIRNFAGFHPIVADFLCDDLEPVEVRKSRIIEAEWDRTLDLGKLYLRSHPGIYRSGAPDRSDRPGKNVS